jgi:hypothetical protein
MSSMPDNGRGGVSDCFELRRGRLLDQDWLRTDMDGGVDWGRIHDHGA